MAKIVITIEDTEQGSVACVMTPNVAETIQLMRADGGLTSAQAYALLAVRVIRETAARQRPAPLRLITPTKED